jgi:hypothetical protein
MNAEDTRVERFLQAAEALSATAWKTIVSRHGKAKKALEAADEFVSDMLVEINRNRVETVEAKEARRDSVRKENERVKALAVAVSAAADPAAAEQTRKAVSIAAQRAKVTLHLFPELLLTTEGRDAAAVILAPFEGFVNAAEL